MAEPLVLSSSSVNTFLSCPRKWYYAYVERRKSPPKLKMARGIAGHEALETDLREVVEGRGHIATEEIVQIYSDAYDEGVIDAEVKPGESKGQIKDGGVRAVKHWHQRVAPTIDPILVEQHGQFVINDVYYDWTADLKDAHGKVRDHKFTGRKPRGGGEYVLNMTGYAVGLRELTGEMETGVQLDYMVCTQKPYFEPVKGGPVPDETVNEFGAIVRDVHDQIQAGFFPPSGLQGYGTCESCGYSADGTCTAYRRSRL